jgi:signal transduction histidine kinase
MVAAQMRLDTFRHDNRQTWLGDWSNFDIGLELVSQAIEELQRLVRGLRPIHLAEGTLATAIECLIKGSKASGGLDIELNHDIQADRIPPEIETAAFRIVQEALANACRHSKSKEVSVGLTQDNDSLCIQVQDWGTGFDTNDAHPGHYGLEGIRRRVKLLGGIVTIRSHPGEGTCISVELPLAAPPSRQPLKGAEAARQPREPLCH